MRLLKCLAMGAALIASASAQTTQDLLAELVETSPALAAVKSETDASRAELWEARGARLPEVRIEAQATSLEETLRVQGVPGELSATRDPASVSAVVEQTLFSSGRVGGSIGAAKATRDAAVHNYDAARQDVLFEGAQAIADVVRDRSILKVRQQNEAVVQVRLVESRARQRAGLATQTDVRQSEARLALARADRINAEGALSRSEAFFERVYGRRAPDTLLLPTAPQVMPQDLQMALDTAFQANPDFAASDDNRRAAKQAVRAERGALLPQISVSASASAIENERFGIDLGEAEQYAVTLNGRWTLFRGGSGYASTRAADRRAKAAESRYRLAERQVREQTIAAWTNWLAARSAVSARKAQVSAAEIAALGVAAEFKSGRRTRLDVLDADREQTDAEVALVASRRDLAVAEFDLLRSIGQL